MSQLTAPFRHPVVACVDGMEELLGQAADLDPGYLPTAEKADVLVRLTRLVDRVEALRLRVLAASMDVAGVEGAPSVAAWLAPRVRATTRSLHGREQLARSLDRRWQHVGEGVSEGRVTMAQAEVIVRALEALDAPAVGDGGERVERVDRELLAMAEKHLVEKAAEFTPAALRTLGDRILEVICPQEYDDVERRALLAAERRASAATRLTLHVRGDGSVDLRARIPEASASRLRTYLEAFTAPRRNPAGGGAGDSGARDEADGRRVPADQRRGQAFCALLETLDPGRLPVHGGTATTVVVTIPYAGLAAGVGVGTLADGTRMSAGEARRLACGAGILPAVLGGDSEVLDLGRTRRLFSTPQRKAFAVTQRTCRAAGCTVPSTWCEAHHGGDPWSRGGRTDLAEGMLLCSWHTTASTTTATWTRRCPTAPSASTDAPRPAAHHRHAPRASTSPARTGVSRRAARGSRGRGTSS